MGGAQTAYGRLPAEAKGSYAELTKALKGRFKPEVLKERHLTQFQAQKKTKTDARGCASLPLPPPSRADCRDPEPMSLPPVTHSYRLAGTVNGIPTTFVVDTGASITVLDEEFWERVNPGNCSLEPWTGRCLVGVEGTPLHVCGVSKVEWYSSILCGLLKAKCGYTEGRIPHPSDR